MTRMIFYRARTKLGRNDTVWIRDDLTKINAYLAFKCRELLRGQKIYTTWSYDGQVFILRTENGSLIPINTVTDLDI